MTTVWLVYSVNDPKYHSGGDSVQGVFTSQVLAASFTSYVTERWKIETYLDHWELDTDYSLDSTWNKEAK